jgi:hypothetical protein
LFSPILPEFIFSHDVIHFRFNAFQLVSSLCEDPEELKQPMEDPDTAFELIWEKNHFDYVSASVSIDHAF